MKVWLSVVLLWMGVCSGLFYPVADFRSLKSSSPSTKPVSQKSVIMSKKVVYNRDQSQTNQVEVPRTPFTQPLYTDDTNAIYYANITVIDADANYYDQFSVLVDTGSPLTWLYNQSASVGSVARFNSPRTLTTSTTISYVYAGESVKCQLVNGNQDVHFRINDLQFTNLTWGLTNDQPSMLAPYPISGLLGISPRANKQNAVSVMANKSLISSAQFSLYLSSQPQTDLAGLMVWGEDTESRQLFSQDTTMWEPVVADQDYWLVNMTQKQQVIIDTGTTGVVLPKKNATELHHRQFGANNVIADDYGNFAFPCNASGSIPVTFANSTLEISVDNVKGNEYKEYPGYCASKIQGIGSQWILGAAFLKGYYTTFDIDHQRIGFAKLAANTTFTLSKQESLSSSASSSSAPTAASSSAVASPQPSRALEGTSSRLVPAGFGVVAMAAMAVVVAA